MQNSRRRLAIVTPIFSGRVSGGSERLIYLYTLMLSKFYEVTVLSTRSLDYISWKNQIPVKEITPVQLGPDIEKKFPPNGWKQIPKIEFEYFAFQSRRNDKFRNLTSIPIGY